MRFSGFLAATGNQAATDQADQAKAQHHQVGWFGNRCAAG
jgi:hypothetical protein